jgi:hypothetical protein
MIPADFPAKPITFDLTEARAVLNTRCLPHNDVQADILAPDPNLPTKTMVRIPIKPQPKYIGGYEGENAGIKIYSWRGLICAPDYYPESSIILNKLPYKKGDFLWVKEPWTPVALVQEPVEYQLSFRKKINVAYQADGEIETIDFGEALNSEYENVIFQHPGCRWFPASFMERPAARIALKINKIRIERVQDITAGDCFDEGIHIEPSGVFNQKRPDDWDKRSETEKNKYAESVARAAYIAGIDFVNNLIDKFGERWDKRYGKRKGLRFSDNPLVQVIEFSRIH